jgi:hypothetical protein
VGSEFMNLIQVISGGQKFIFPVTYVHLQAVLMIIPMLMLIFFTRRILHSSPHPYNYVWIFGIINLEVFIVYISISKAFAQSIWWTMDFFDIKKKEEKAA